MEVLLITIIWAGVIQGTLLGALFLFSNKYRSISNLLLGGFLFSFVFVAFTDILPFNYIGTYPINGYFLLPEVKLLSSVLFLHFFIEKMQLKYKTLLTLHYMIAVVIICLTLFNIIFFVFSGKTMHDLLDWKTIEKIFMLQQYYAFGFTIVALVIALTEIKRYRQIARDEYSDFALFQINWLWQFALAMAPVIILWGTELIRIALGGQGGQSDIVLITWGLIAVILYFVSFKAFNQPNLFRVQKHANPGRKMEKLSYSEIENPLRQCMEKEKLYLRQDLTIHDVSKYMGSSSRKISQCINDRFGSNFSEWVNGYRIDEVKNRFLEPDSKFLTIEAIGQESGFKSRSAMYLAFRKILGISPAKLRE